MAVLGPRCCARAFSSCGKRGPLFIAVRGPLTIAAFLVAEHRFQTRRLSNRGSRAQPLHGMQDLPRPGLEPVSPAPAGRLSTTAPPGKPRTIRYWRKKLKKTLINGRLFCGHGLEEFILLKCPYYPKQSTYSMQSLSKCQWHFSQD